MKKALHALENGTSLGAASKEFQIPKTTLRRRFKDQNNYMPKTIQKFLVTTR